MRIHKALAVGVATVGISFALQGAPAANAHNTCKPSTYGSSDLSPSSRAAWTSFICGGGQLTGGAAKMVSGAWIGAAPTIVAGATGAELTADQQEAWDNWDRGANQAGIGAAKLVAGAYVGAPGIVMDKIMSGALPTDLTPAELRQVSFAVDPTSQIGQDIPGLPELPLPELPIDLTDLLEILQGF
jgi:hypothetical protein